MQSDKKNTKENIKESEPVSTDSVDYKVSLSVESDTDGEKSKGSKEGGEICKIEGEEACSNTQDGESTKDSEEHADGNKTEEGEICKVDLEEASGNTQGGEGTRQ